MSLRRAVYYCPKDVELVFKSVKPPLIIILIRAEDRAAMHRIMLIVFPNRQDLAKLNLDFFRVCVNTSFEARSNHLGILNCYQCM